MSWNCAECSSFNPMYKGGWCNYHDRPASPGGSCSQSDSSGSWVDGDDEHTCKNCSSYSCGYCRYHECYTNSDSYCSDWD